MSNFDPAAYGQPTRELLQRAPLNPLDGGWPDVSARPLLQALTDSSFARSAVLDRNMAAACRAGLWLRFNYLDDAHKIAQDIDTPEGSFWHGIVHRREGDYDNAKYWFRRVGAHAIFDPLQKSAAALQPESGNPLSSSAGWDPFAFVDLCAGVIRGQAQLGSFCLDLQRMEWELLFDYCWRQASA
jgi:hypothetical protein